MLDKRENKGNDGALPLEISNLTNLQYLYLDGNQLTEIPPEIEKIPNLTIER